MPHRLRWDRSTMSLPLRITILLMFAGPLTIGCERNPNVASSVSTDAADSDKVDPTFAIPQGKPSKIIAFVRELEKRNPEFSSAFEKEVYEDKLRRTVIRAGDKILAQSADNATLKEALAKKLNATFEIASKGDETFAKQLLDEVDRFRTDHRPAVADVANQFWIVAQSMNLSAISTEEREKLVTESIQRVLRAKFSNESINESAILSKELIKINEISLSTSLMERLADEIKKTSSDSKLRSLAQYLKGQVAKTRLIGSTIAIEGKLLNGDPFQWDSYRGKIVLIDFWATWCGPCIGELPNVKASYDKYHDRGFDVVAISLDTNRKALERFIEKESLPWDQLFEDSPEKGVATMHPMARRYGVLNIPAAFLVDREGIVVSVDAHGEELDRLLKKMIDTTN